MRTKFLKMWFDAYLEGDRDKFDMIERILKENDIDKNIYCK